MTPATKRSQLLLLPLALCGFAIAQTIYDLLLATPVFLVARQNTRADVLILAGVFSLLLPLLAAAPGWLAARRWPALGSFWGWSISGAFGALFVAQLLQGPLGAQTWAFVGLSLAIGFAAAWGLLFTRWRMLTPVLAVIAAGFPIWFLAVSPALDQVEDFAVPPARQSEALDTLPDVVFVLLDELPLATLLDETLNVDAFLFPNFARLQSMSDWYYDTASVSDGTGSAIPAILSGRYPGEVSKLTVAEQPVNLFTALRQHYRYNVSEAVTRMCPNALCPRAGPGTLSRSKALLLDLTAIYLHRVVPNAWAPALPQVTNNWSGFFAPRQVFFPEGWSKHAGDQTEIDRPTYFRRFVDSIRRTETPGFNFLHILFPHEPNAYLPDGRNYGLEWMRGQHKEVWGDVEWGVISGKQRHFLQVQFADRLLGELLDHLEAQAMLEQSALVVLADHGISFELNDTRRALSDINHASLLRVPLFFKRPGQRVARRLETPAMTVDIFPTLLAALGFDPRPLGLDGMDLAQTGTALGRSRVANSFRDRPLRELDERQLDVHRLVDRNRAQLKASRPGKALWEIGPYDQHRGQALSTVCTPRTGTLDARFDAFNPLPNTDRENTLPAYVKGRFRGLEETHASSPFIITSQGVIAASGHTWSFNGQILFFALVEPRYVEQPDWLPTAWLVQGNDCLGSTRD